MLVNGIERSWGFSARAAAVAATLALGLWSPANAIAEPDPEEPATTVQAQPDFRFAAPGGNVGVRGGWRFNRSEGEIYDFLTDMLTLESSSFDAPVFALDVGWGVAERVDLVFGFEYSRSSKRSEFRDYVDQDGIPIVQDTRLTQVPLTLSAKIYLTPRGRTVGQYAWVPSAVVPYVGGGAGFTYYRLEQSGEFVDFIDLSIFEDFFLSSGWTVAAHAFVGLDVKLSPTMGFVMEGRYHWANADLRGSFIGFEPIDLNGARAMIGVNWKF